MEVGRKKSDFGHLTSVFCHLILCVLRSNKLNQQINSVNSTNLINQLPPMEDIRIAAVTLNSAVNQVNHNLDRMLPWIEKARTKGADLICFPELNVYFHYHCILAENDRLTKKYLLYGPSMAEGGWE